VDPGDVDDLDARIVEWLFEDGRASYRSIAAGLDVSASTVAARIQQLEADGAITAYRPTIDYGEFGLPITAIIHLKATACVDPSGILSAVRSLVGEVVDRTGEHSPGDHEEWLGVPQLSRAYRVTGPNDWMTIWRFPDLETLAAAVTGLRTDLENVQIRTEIARESPALAPTTVRPRDVIDDTA
jgi:DNA-binding Lrp family transcriptional regulator